MLIHRRFTKQFILERIKTILENNNFLFDDQFYNQIRGTAMGAKFAPTYATLVLGYLEEKLIKRLEPTDKQFSLYVREQWKRYLDDCFILWTRSVEELHHFHNILNSLHSDIKFTIELNENKLPFLDILIIKYNTQLSTDIYYKETDTKQYLDFKSCHPSHTKRSIPYNLARRICTIVSDSFLRSIRLNELKQALLSRGYPQNLIESGIQKATQIPRNELLIPNTTQSNNIITFVSTYNPKNPEMFTEIKKNNMPILMNDPKMRAVLRTTNFIKVNANHQTSRSY